ncbi:MAG: ferritin-like domain-containing protein [Chloroflexia bacterium]
MEIEQTRSSNGGNLAKGALALGGAALIAATIPTPTGNPRRVFAQGAPFKDDLEILNFALTLEFFEAELYTTLAASGKLQGRDLQFIQMFGQHEQAHVAAVMTTIQKLGGTPVQKAAYNFPTLNTREEVLNLLVTVEQTGTSAYQGAAPFIQNKDILSAAGSILTVEARHTAMIRYLLGLAPSPDAFTAPLSKDEVLAKVAPFFK